MDRDRGDGRARTGPGTPDPVRRRSEEERCECDDQDETRDDEGETSDDSRSRPASSPRRVDRELGRGWTGEEVDRGEAVLELVRSDPSASVDNEIPQERDVRGRSAEADDPDPPPRACDSFERGRAAVQPDAVPSAASPSPTATTSWRRKRKSSAKNPTAIITALPRYATWKPSTSACA